MTSSEIFLMCHPRGCVSMTIPTFDWLKERGLSVGLWCALKWSPIIKLHRCLQLLASDRKAFMSRLPDASSFLSSYLFLRITSKCWQGNELLKLLWSAKHAYIFKTKPRWTYFSTAFGNWLIKAFEQLASGLRRVDEFCFSFFSVETKQS